MAIYKDFITLLTNTKSHYINYPCGQRKSKEHSHRSTDRTNNQVSGGNDFNLIPDFLSHCPKGHVDFRAAIVDRTVCSVEKGMAEDCKG